MQIVEREDEFDAVFPRLTQNPFIVPVFTDTKAHPAINPLSVLFVSADGANYVLAFDHTDADRLPMSCLDRLVTAWQATSVRTLSAKPLMHALGAPLTATDTLGREYTLTGEIAPLDRLWTPYMKTMYGKYHDRPNLNRVIPLMKWMDYFKRCQAYDQLIQTRWETEASDAMNSELMFLCNRIVTVCHGLEGSGVHIIKNRFVESLNTSTHQLLDRFIQNDLVYTEYNPYTTTGRVTNRFLGKNFTAINKTNGEREAYTSRHPNGMMVLMDFDSFHLRLIAELIGYTAPDEPFHVHLAKQYFQTDAPTKEQYDEGKKITFANLYGSQGTVDIPFFRQVQDYITRQWGIITDTGVIQLEGKTIRLNRMEQPNPAKVFNYILQWQETNVAFQALDRIRGLYKTTQSKLTLYTYDSLLIDFCPADGATLLKQTVNQLEMDGRFPVRVYVGTNYQQMTDVTGKFKTK